MATDPDSDCNRHGDHVGQELEKFRFNVDDEPSVATGTPHEKFQ
jgi:hypothetical protein